MERRNFSFYNCLLMVKNQLLNMYYITATTIHLVAEGGTCFGNFIKKQVNVLGLFSFQIMHINELQFAKETL